MQHKSVFIGLKDAEGCNEWRLMKTELLNMQLCGFWYVWIVYGCISLLQNTVSRRWGGSLHHVGISRTSGLAYVSTQEPEDVRRFLSRYFWSSRSFSLGGEQELILWVPHEHQGLLILGYLAAYNGSLGSKQNCAWYI